MRITNAVNVLYWVKRIVGICFLLGMRVLLMAQPAMPPSSMSLHLQDTPLAEALGVFEKETLIELVYSLDALPARAVVNVNIKSKTPKEALSAILGKTQLAFTEVGTRWVLYTDADKEIVRNSVTLSGYVLDLFTKEPIVGAILFSDRPSFVLTTNYDGYYNVTLPEDTFDLAVHFVGYEPVIQKIRLGMSVNQNILLKASTELAEIEIVAATLQEYQKDSLFALSDKQIEAAQVKQLVLPGGEADLARTLTTLPGVQSGLGVSGLYVRGGESDQNLVTLDGVPLYNASHAFGLLSVFNTSAIKSARLIKSGFPAQYGGRLSSILQVSSKEGSKERMAGEVSLGLIALRAELEGPLLNQKGSFMLSVRRSLLDFWVNPAKKILKLDAEDYDNEFNYNLNDVNANLAFRLSENHKLMATFYYGSDIFSNEYNFLNLQDTLSYRYTDKLTLKWGNILGQLRWRWLIKSKTELNLTAYYTQFALTNNNLVKQIESLDNTAVFERFRYTVYNSNVRDIAAKVELSRRFTQHYQILTGAQTTQHQYLPGANSIQQQGTFTLNADTLFNNRQVIAHEQNVFLDNILAIKKLRCSAGVYSSLFIQGNTHYASVQPRLSVVYAISSKWRVNASYSEMQQYVHLLTNSGLGLPTDIWIPSDSIIKPQYARQGVVGFLYAPAKGWSISAETYYKKLNRLISYADGSNFLLNTTNWGERVTVGEGTAYGAELLIERTEAKTTGWLGYTIAKSVRTFPSIDEGQPFPFKYDRRHALSVQVYHKFDTHFSTSLAWSFATGSATTLPIRAYDYVDEQGNTITVYEYGSRNSTRLPTEHRLDIGGNYTWQKDNVRQNIQLGIYNVYNRKNPLYITLTPNPNDITRNEYRLVNQFPIMPTFSYEMTF